MKQHTQEATKKDYLDGRISKRTAKLRLEREMPGKKAATRRSAIFSEWNRTKQKVTDN